MFQGSGCHPDQLKLEGGAVQTDFPDAEIAHEKFKGGQYRHNPWG